LRSATTKNLFAVESMLQKADPSPLAQDDRVEDDVVGQRR
jgi:hypothetical protein